MAFSSLSIEQLTFEADDRRCNKQNIDSFESLVNYDSEFPQRESLVFKNLFFKKKPNLKKSINNSGSSSEGEENIIEDYLEKNVKVLNEHSSGESIKPLDKTKVRLASHVDVLLDTKQIGNESESTKK